MVGNIMTAEQALRTYGDVFGSITRSPGGLIEMRNSVGNLMRVHPGAIVYHRGNGKFAKYSELRDLRYDKARKQSGWNHDGAKPPIGKRKHQGDTRRSRQGGYV